MAETPGQQPPAQPDPAAENGRLAPEVDDPGNSETVFRFEELKTELEGWTASNQRSS
jgi:hypothetical protein